ncbi:hypothetical protein Tco_1083280, partial [Tanacetum coccineum]
KFWEAWRVRAWEGMRRPWAGEEPLSTLGSLNVDNDPFRRCEGDEDVRGQEVSYLSARDGKRPETDGEN